MGWQASPGGRRNRDDAVVSDAEPAWSEETGQASWIGERLAPFDAYVVTSVVPGGFEAYARVLHPAEDPLHGGDRVVRWAEVAAWSGLPLRPGSQFHSIALPRARPEGKAPWASQGPHQGSLYPPDAVILAGILRDWTTTPQRCWFCVWDGYGWDGVYLTASAGAATGTDLAWTFVGGPAGLIGQLLAETRIEALPAAPDGELSGIEDWVTALAEQTAGQLLSSGEATVTTSRGANRQPPSAPA